MISFLWTFQFRINGVNPHLLLSMAIVTVAAGLFVWLGGIGFRKILFTLVGVYCGIACAIPISGTNLLLAISLAGACLLLALKLQDGFLVLTASLFAAVYGFSVLIRPYFDPSDELIAVVRQLAIGVPYYNWPILLFLIALPPAAKSSFWRGSSAVLLSMAGACIIFAGIIILMVRSGASAAGFISSKQEIFLGLLIAFTTLGAIIQLLLLPKLGSRFAGVTQTIKTKTKRTRKNKHDSSDSAPASKSTAWRTA